MNFVTQFGNNTLNSFRLFGFVLLTILLVSVVWVAVVTHQNADLSPASSILRFAVDNHVVIMLILVILGVIYGYIWSIVSSRALDKKSKAGRSMLETILLFLNSDEKKILQFLANHNGSANQSEISRLDGMHRVKAHRSLQKMQEKNLIDIIPNGKIRKIQLKENILSIISE